MDIKYVDNLIYFTNLFILNKVDGITILQDEGIFFIKIVSILSVGCNGNNFILKFPQIIFRYLCARHRRAMCSLYGSLIFDTTKSNRRVGFVAPFSAEQGLYLMRSARRNKPNRHDIL